MPVPPEGPVGWGLVGLGRHAERYIAAAIAASRTSTLAAVCSNTADRARDFAGRLDAAAAYDSLGRMLADDRVHCIFICSANNAHAEQAIQAAESGRPVLCEKPLALTAEACLKVGLACEHSGVTLGVGFHLRHNPVHQEARRLLATGAVGRLLFAEIQYVHRSVSHPPRTAADERRRRQRGTGEFTGAALHALDLLGYLLGGEAVAVTATTMSDPGADSGSGTRVTQVTATWNKGLLASMSTGSMPFAHNAASFHGTHGLLRLENSIGNAGGGQIEIQAPEHRSSLSFPVTNPYQMEIDDFVTAVRAGRPAMAGAADAVRAAHLVAAIEESQTNRREAAVTRLGTDLT